jgi:glycosyltransferase involved in cell wall biosynthesis
MRDPYRAAFVTSNLAIGGAERAWAALLPRLAEHGFDVRVLTLRQEGLFFDQLREQGIPAACAHLRRRTDVAGLRRAFRVLDGGVDLVVSQSVDAQVVGVAMARRARVPHVTIDQAGPGLPLTWHQRLLLRTLVAPSVDLLIAVSALQLERLLPLGFRENRIRVIPNAVESLTPRRPRPDVRRELGLDDDAFVALLAADLRPVKNAPLFVEAVTAAARRDSRVRAIVAGGGVDFEEIAALADGTGGVVRMLGPRGDVPELMAAADVVCLSSWTEALPLTLIEAMSLGKPVLSTAVGGVPEIVLDGETGLLVPPGEPEPYADALVRMAGDPALLRRLGDAGRARHHERFDVAQMVADYAEALSGVVERRRA